MTHMGIPPLSGPNKNAEASKRPSHGEYRENMKQEAVRLNAEQEKLSKGRLAVEFPREATCRVANDKQSGVSAAQGL